MDSASSNGTFDPNVYSRKLNLGCGTDRRPGFLNVDFDSSHNPDLVADVTRLRILPSGFYKQILAHDILEHVSRLKCLNTLKEWNRLLEIGGHLELRVPNLIGLLNLFKLEEFQTIDGQKTLVRNLFGTQCYRGDFHHIGFTELMLDHFLSDAGFEILSQMETDGWLFNVVAKKVKNTQIDSIFDIDEDKEFVKQVYYSKLFRRAQDSDIHHYLKILEDGIPREAVLEAIESSVEHELTNDSHEDCGHLLQLESDEEFIHRAYEELLRRAADAGGVEYYKSLLDDGAPRKVVIAGLKSSEEYMEVKTAQ